MKHRSKNIKARNKKLSNLISTAFLFCFLFLNVFIFYAQDSIALPKDLNEEKELKFQQYFFKALSEKSINNFQRAIENLENCNQILANDVSVFFEFSKNYYKLNNTQLAKEYITRALAKDTDNIWMLKHLVLVHQQENNYEDAILVQQKVIALKPQEIKEIEALSRLFLRNNQPKKALELLRKLDTLNGLPSYLSKVKTSLEKRNSGFKKKNAPVKLGSFTGAFEKEKTYQNLEILLKTTKSDSVLLKYSLEGMKLFPAQPFVYLVHARVLNKQKSYKRAVKVLENGIDFVIEDAMEKDFFKEIAKGYKGIGNSHKARKFLLKSKK